MGKGNRPAACVVTGKRLRAKSWYYRNGNYFYNKRVWRQEREKLAGEAAKAKVEAKAKKETAAATEPDQAPTPAQPDAKPPSS